MNLQKNDKVKKAKQLNSSPTGIACQICDLLVTSDNPIKRKLNRTMMFNY